MKVFVTQKIQLNKYVSSKKDSNFLQFRLKLAYFAMSAILNKLSKEQKIFRPNDFWHRKIFYEITFGTSNFLMFQTCVRISVVTVPNVLSKIKPIISNLWEPKNCFV